MLTGKSTRLTPTLIGDWRLPFRQNLTDALGDESDWIPDSLSLLHLDAPIVGCHVAR
jgi:hypothetical protein